MKKIFITLLSASILSTIAVGAVATNKHVFVKETVMVNAASPTKPTTIDLKDNSEEEIREYWSYLNDLPESERRGENLLKNLKYIMVNNPAHPDKTARYFSYSVCRDIYDITDRNWVKSPASEISGYDASSNTITGFKYGENPYLYYYYRNDNYTNPHKAEDKVSPVDGEGTPQAILNQEHLWSKSHGFSEKQNAGSDLHHLVAGDQAVNKWAHSNHSHGYVQNEDSSWAAARVKWGENDALLGNKNGNPLHSASQDESNTVFEPRDEDKGDVARALFYMVARYNYIGDDITKASEAEPNLTLVDYVISNETTQVCDGTNGAAKYGKLSDLLDWVKVDPVNDSTNEGMHEIHRNNLIYNNYQYTRNPFIDFPDWIELIWGEKASTGKADPSIDRLYGINKVAPTSITLSAAKTEIKKGETVKVNVSSVAPSDASKAVTYSSSNENIATVDASGNVKGIGEGEVTITATSKLDSNVKATITIKVTVDKINPVILIVGGIGAVVVIIILIVVFANMSKKQRKSAMKKITKSVKSSSKKKSKK